MLWPDGRSVYYKNCVTTPGKPTWKGATGIVYCITQEVRIPALRDTVLTFRSRLQDQEFVTQSEPIYEGVGTVTGTLLGKRVSGDAWIEQIIAAKSRDRRKRKRS
jgi:hypothetical protein